MSNSPNIRMPLEDHEDAERIALKISLKEQKITTKNEVMKKALKIGLGKLKDEYEITNGKIQIK